MLAAEFIPFVNIYNFVDVPSSRDQARMEWFYRVGLECVELVQMQLVFRDLGKVVELGEDQRNSLKRPGTLFDTRFLFGLKMAFLGGIFLKKN